MSRAACPNPPSEGESSAQTSTVTPSTPSFTSTATSGNPTNSPVSSISVATAASTTPSNSSPSTATPGLAFGASARNSATTTSAKPSFNFGLGFSASQYSQGLPSFGTKAIVSPATSASSFGTTGGFTSSPPPAKPFFASSSASSSTSGSQGPPSFVTQPSSVSSSASLFAAKPPATTRSVHQASTPKRASARPEENDDPSSQGSSSPPPPRHTSTASSSFSFAAPSSSSFSSSSSSSGFTFGGSTAASTGFTLGGTSGYSSAFSTLPAMGPTAASGFSFGGTTHPVAAPLGGFGTGFGTAHPVAAPLGGFGAGFGAAPAVAASLGGGFGAGFGGITVANAPKPISWDWRNCARAMVSEDFTEEDLTTPGKYLQPQHQIRCNIRWTDDLVMSTVLITDANPDGGAAAGNALAPVASSSNAAAATTASTNSTTIPAGPGSPVLYPLKNMGQMCFNLFGDLLFTHADAHVIVMMLPDGSIVNVAGIKGTAGTANGEASKALFNNPSGLAVDHRNRVIVADTQNHCIRLINNLGMVSNLSATALWPLPSAAAPPVYVDGPTPSAFFNMPTQLTMTKTGDLLIMDLGNNAIRLMSHGLEGLLDLSHSHVFTIMKAQELSIARSINILPSGSLLLQPRYPPFPIVLQRDGRPDAWGVSGEDFADTCIASGPDGDMAVFVTNASPTLSVSIALAPLDEEGRVDRTGHPNLKPKTLLGSLPTVPGATVPGAFAFGNSPELTKSCIVPLPDGNGWMVAYSHSSPFGAAPPTNPWRIIQVGNGTPHLPFPHRVKPFHFAPLNSSSHSAHFIELFSPIVRNHPINHKPYYLFPLILQLRCPALLETSVQDKLFSTQMPTDTFDDLFSFIYEDRIAPFSVIHHIAIFHLVDLHQLATICQLNAFAEFLKHRIFTIMSSTSSKVDIMAVISHAAKGGFVTGSGSLMDFLLDFLASGPRTGVQAQTEQLIDMLADSRDTLKAVMAKLVNPRSFVLPSNASPFMQLGACFKEMVPNMGRYKPDLEPDFEVIIDNSVIKCHKLILAARWPYFASVLLAGLSEAQSGRLELPADYGFNESTILGLMNLWYTGSLETLTDEEGCAAILEHASYFGFDADLDLIDHCKKQTIYLTLSQDLDPVTLFARCLETGDVRFMARARRNVVANLKTVLDQHLEEFEDLPLDERNAILLMSHKMTVQQ